MALFKVIVKLIIAAVILAYTLPYLMAVINTNTRENLVVGVGKLLIAD